MLRLPAPAKLNLYLHITGRRADGYHLLDSLMVFTDLADRLTIEPGDGFHLTLTGPFAGPLESAGNNLAERAARALGDALGKPVDIAMTLEKHIPVAAGLGGGSADAAAVLRGLASLWELGADHEAVLHRIALGLGADVPVCLDCRPAFVSGIGEALSAPPELPACPVLLANAGVPVSTAAVFAARQGAYSSDGRFADAPETAQALAALLRERRNDLEPAARGLAPEIARVLARLETAPGCALSRMTGSGGTCFALFEDEAAADAAAGAIAAEQPTWWLYTTRLVGSAGS